MPHEAFLSGMSEFDINLAYLTATGHRDTDVPYDNIVALNEHASVPHYTVDHQPPAESLSFRSTSAEYNGYAADLTRTYAAQSGSEFAHLVKDLNSEQLALIDTIKTGVRYTDYHADASAHRQAAQESQPVNGLSEEAMVETGITTPSSPHGLGHPLGLQVHDAAGFMQDEQGTHWRRRPSNSFLRCTRVLQPGAVLTIEPAPYFIEFCWRCGAAASSSSTSPGIASMR